MIKKIELTKIKKFLGYFHDGSILNIEYKKNDLSISLESAEVVDEWEWNREAFPLSKRSTVSGKIHLNGITSIKENEQPIKIFNMKTNDCELFDIELTKNNLKLLILWETFKPKKTKSDIFTIEIEAKEIYFENIPTLSDYYWDNIK